MQREFPGISWYRGSSFRDEGPSFGIARLAQKESSIHDEDDLRYFGADGGRSSGAAGQSERHHDREAGRGEQHRDRWIPLQLRAERRPEEGGDSRTEERGHRQRGAQRRR